MIKGDRILLISKRHGIAKSNPVVGSRHECEGTVTLVPGAKSLSKFLEVYWDNGHRNSYNKNDLMLTKKDECNSIW